MSGVLLHTKKRHEEGVSLSDALKRDVERKAATKGLISKRATLVTAGITDGELKKLVGGDMTPDAGQLSRINAFTRTPKTAEEVVTFNTLSCNDMVDRDDDQFTTQCVKDFAALDGPFSSVGKSYMLDHDYKLDKAVGRIYGADTAKVSGVTYLTNEVYLPNTAQFQPLIEKIDFGIAWAVSVGVVLGKDECAVCGEPFSSWGWWCVEGHDKGYYYDPKSTETDSWGYPIPCDPNTSGAIKCVRKFSEPRDFYELSQVFLGAQYNAAVSDKAAGGLLKAASPGSVLALGAAEDLDIPLRHLPKRVSDARARYEMKETDDGSLVWTDEDKMVWSFDPENPDDVLCLGKSSEQEEETEDGEPAVSGEEDGDGDGEVAGSGVSDEGAGDGDESDDAAEDGDEAGEEGVADEDEEETDEQEEKSLSKADVLAAAKRARLGDEKVAVIEAGDGTGLDALLRSLSSEVSALQTEKAALTAKAALGDEYVGSLRKEAVQVYVAAHTDGKKGVSTTTFEKMLDKFGDDVDLLRSVIEENKALAQERFPKSVRRSSFQTDPHESKITGDEEPLSTSDAERIRRLHG